jgi:putative SOS response-associated peptidase YedK
MCGRFNATFDSGVKKVYTNLKIHKVIDKPVDSRFIRAADTLSIVRNVGDQRRVENAMWWLLLEETENGFKPSKYTSFNTRYDKLNIPHSAGYTAYRESRCAIVAKGFGETQFVNKKPVHYHDMVAEHGGLVFGGLCREWHHQRTGKKKLSCSVITLPPHEKLKHIHSKAMPLILPQSPELIDDWLNPALDNVAQFDGLLTPHIPQNIIAQQIDKPSSFNPIGGNLIIPKDTN